MKLFMACSLCMHNNRPTHCSCQLQCDCVMCIVLVICYCVIKLFCCDFLRAVRSDVFNVQLHAVYIKKNDFPRLGIWLEFDYNDRSLQSKQPAYLYSCLAVQPNNVTRSSSSLTLFRPTVTSRLQITERYFHHQAPVLWDTNFLHHSHSQSHYFGLTISCSLIISI